MPFHCACLPSRMVCIIAMLSSWMSASDRLSLCLVDHSGRAGWYGPWGAEGDWHQCVRSPPQAYQRHRETAGRSARSEHLGYLVKVMASWVTSLILSPVLHIWHEMNNRPFPFYFLFYTTELLNSLIGHKQWNIIHRYGILKICVCVCVHACMHCVCACVCVGGWPGRCQSIPDIPLCESGHSPDWPGTWR